MSLFFWSEPEEIAVWNPKDNRVDFFRIKVIYSGGRTIVEWGVIYKLSVKGITNGTKDWVLFLSLIGQTKLISIKH